MPYRTIAYDHIKDPAKHNIFLRADLYLSDVYSMLGLRVVEGSNAGGCNFSIALVLLAVIDGIGRGIYPTEISVDDHQQRFCKLIRDKLPWPLPGPNTIDRGLAAKRLYVELRNPLTHQLGRDGTEITRPPGEYEIVVYRWLTNAPGNVDELDAMPKQFLPVLRWEPHKDGKRLALSGAGLYWAVKRMTMDLAAQEQ